MRAPARRTDGNRSSTNVPPAPNDRFGLRAMQTATNSREVMSTCRRRRARSGRLASGRTAAPSAARHQRNLRRGRPWLASLAAAAALDGLEDLPHRRSARGDGAGGHGLAVCPYRGAAVARASRPAAVDLTTFALAMSLATLMIVVVLGAVPPVRARVHNVFELTHRFGGWTSVGLFWALTVHLLHGDLGAWQIWLLRLITASIVWPWLTLRRVPVTVERPSSHAAIVHLDYGVTPAHVTAVGISRSPLREWHAFATEDCPAAPTLTRTRYSAQPSSGWPDSDVYRVGAYAASSPGAMPCSRKIARSLSSSAFTRPNSLASDGGPAAVWVHSFSRPARAASFIVDTPAATPSRMRASTSVSSSLRPKIEGYFSVPFRAER